MNRRSRLTNQSTHRAGRKLIGITIAVAVAAGGMLAFQLFRPRLMTERIPAASQATPVAVISENSIAVLPFVDMSQAKDQGYFSDGISEELLNLLGRIPQLKVPSRTSSFSFKGKQVEIPEIARQLHVANVLEGSVRKSGDQLRITAQLIRAADGYHLWSETYDRKMDDIFKIQDEIAVAYAVVAWLLIQIATQVFPFFEIPNWAVRLVVLPCGVSYGDLQLDERFEGLRESPRFQKIVASVAPKERSSGAR